MNTALSPTLTSSRHTQFLGLGEHYHLLMDPESGGLDVYELCTLVIMIEKLMHTHSQSISINMIMILTTWPIYTTGDQNC